MKKTCWVCVTLVKRACRNCVSVYSCVTSCQIRARALLEPTWTAITKWRNKVRHRVAGNRMSMPEPRRRSARRNLMAGVIFYDCIKKTEARAPAICGGAGKGISIADQRGIEGQPQLKAVVFG